eukprot:SAG11_NODE_2368_length_3448_cov_12.401015_5_plen_121_part_00
MNDSSDEGEVVDAFAELLDEFASSDEDEQLPPIVALSSASESVHEPEAEAEHERRQHATARAELAQRDFGGHVEFDTPLDVPDFELTCCPWLAPALDENCWNTLSAMYLSGRAVKVSWPA